MKALGKDYGLNIDALCMGNLSMDLVLGGCAIFIGRGPGLRRQPGSLHLVHALRTGGIWHAGREGIRCILLGTCFGTVSCFPVPNNVLASS